MVERRTPRGRGFDPHSSRRVVSLGKIRLPPKSTGNTQEAMAPFRRDWKIVYCKMKRNEINHLSRLLTVFHS